MRLLHTMLRVGNLQRSIDFYTQVMGMQLLRTTTRPEQQYDLAFVGYVIGERHPVWLVLQAGVLSVGLYFIMGPLLGVRL